jgi:hypothetical protein
MLAMENAAFFAGISIAPTLPFYAELSGAPAKPEEALA